MHETIQMLERQAEWQRNRCQLSWADKLRQAVAMRESLRGFRKAVPASSEPAHAGVGGHPDRPYDSCGRV